ncbi:MAG: VPLPA-CTERM sorting domain-containing protein [Gammaproteobacteria bacterium]|nr:VPLPA-CTERM sorting domain-containing protein [Gammaproteobacteria bacterium]
MIKIEKILSVTAWVFIMLLSMSSAKAALVNFEIQGTVIAGDEFGDPNAFNLSSGETIMASGIFDDSVLSAGMHDVFFGSGNVLSIDVNGTIFTHADDAAASLSFTDGVLTDFDFMVAGSFNSNFTQFDDFGLMFGEWNAVVATSPVPVPAAAWLFGSGLIALVGFVRRKK